MQIATRSQDSHKPPISYVEQLQTSYIEDDRASDLSYQLSSDDDMSENETDTTSDETIPDKPCAPIVNYPNHSSLPSSPHYPNNQTPEPHSSTPTPEPYNPTPTPEPYSSTLTPEPYSSTLTPEPYSSNHNIEHTLTEPYSPEITQLTETPKSTHSVTSEDLPDIPITPKGNITNALKSQTKDDQSLKIIKGLAHHSKNGYEWENGLLFHTTTDNTLGEQKRLVVPKLHRLKLIKLAHNKSGHFL